MYYLFSRHNWGLRDLQELWLGDTRWRDLIFAMSSYEANLNKPPRPTAAVKVTKRN